MVHLSGAGHYDTQNKESVPSDEVSTKVLGAPLEKNNGEENLIELPTAYSIGQNFPNPFNPSTIINYSTKEAGFVKLKVYDILGNEVAVLVNETKESGYHSVEFTASNLPSGVYIYTLQVNGFNESKKMILIR